MTSSCGTIFLLSTAIRCKAEKCSYASLFTIQLYNFSCDCLCAFDYLMRIAVILIVTLKLSCAWYIHNKLPPNTQEEERDRILDVDI
jgi:hypothetical protein